MRANRPQCVQALATLAGRHFSLTLDEAEAFVADVIDDREMRAPRGGGQ